MTGRSPEVDAVGTSEATDTDPGPWMPPSVADWKGNETTLRHPFAGPQHEALFSAYYEFGVTEQRNRKGRVTREARPPSVRYVGPLGGHRVVVDPDYLEAEASRLIEVARTLRCLQAIDPEPPEGALL